MHINVKESVLHACMNVMLLKIAEFLQINLLPGGRQPFRGRGPESLVQGPAGLYHSHNTIHTLRALHFPCLQIGDLFFIRRSVDSKFQFMHMQVITINHKYRC